MATYLKAPHGEPNRRQQLAVDRVEIALDELASILLSSCRDAGLARDAVGRIRRTVALVIADILDAD